MSSSRGHSAYLVYQIIKNRVIQKVIPSLGKKSNAQKYFSIFLIIVGLLSMLGFGIYLDGYVLHPPAHYTGICAPPDTISGNGQRCTYSQIETITQGSTTKTVIVQVPAGQVLLPNSNTTTTVTKTVTK